MNFSILLLNLSHLSQILCLISLNVWLLDEQWGCWLIRGGSSIRLLSFLHSSIGLLIFQRALTNFSLPYFVRCLRLYFWRLLFFHPRCYEPFDLLVGQVKLYQILLVSLCEHRSLWRDITEAYSVLFNDRWGFREMLFKESKLIFV